MDIKVPVKVLKRTAEFSHKISLSSGGSILTMASLLAGAQITISLISMTGFGVKLSDLIISIGQSNVFFSLVLAMIVCIVLGMGLPTTAAYVLSASILAPAVIQLGVPVLPAHLFVMYFATVATITPPVCAAIFLSSGMAKANWLKAGWLGILLALPAFIVPYNFTYDTSMLLMGSTASIVWAVVSSIVGVFYLGVAVAGYFKKPMRMFERAILFIGGGAMLVPNITVAFVGLAVGSIMVLLNTRTAKTSGIKELA